MGGWRKTGCCPSLGDDRVSPKRRSPWPNPATPAPPPARPARASINPVGHSAFRTGVSPTAHVRQLAASSGRPGATRGARRGLVWCAPPGLTFWSSRTGAPASRPHLRRASSFRGRDQKSSVSSLSLRRPSFAPTSLATICCIHWHCNRPDRLNPGLRRAPLGSNFFLLGSAE